MQFRSACTELLKNRDQIWISGPLLFFIDAEKRFCFYSSDTRQSRSSQTYLTSGTNTRLIQIPQMGSLTKLQKLARDHIVVHPI